MRQSLTNNVKVKVIEALTVVRQRGATPPYGHNIGNRSPLAVGRGVGGAIDKESRGERGIVVGS